MLSLVKKLMFVCIFISHIYASSIIIFLLLHIYKYLHLRSNPLMNIKIFATVHNLMNDTNLIDRCHAIRFQHQAHSPEVTLVL